MPTIAGVKVFPPNSWDEFEDITLSAVRIRWESPDFFRNGRPGQRQDGVDIFGMVNGVTPIGIQCKNTVDELSEKIILKEIRNAESFNPPIAILYVATTLNRDARLQEKVRILSAERTLQGKFPVHILFWSEVVFDLTKDKAEFFKYYPDYAPESLKKSVQSDNGHLVFSIEQMKIERHPSFSGKSIRRLALIRVGGLVIFFGSVSLFLTLFSSFFGVFSNWTPLAMLIFFVGMMLLVTPSVLKRRRFECIWLRKFYVELSTADNLYINSLTAICPWCESNMVLRHCGDKDEPKEDIFICERNSRQHTVILDPTLLPEIED